MKLRHLIFIAAISANAGTLSFSDGTIFNDACAFSMPGSSCADQRSFTTADGAFTIAYSVTAQNSGTQSETIAFTVTKLTSSLTQLVLEYEQAYAVTGNYPALVGSLASSGNCDIGGTVLRYVTLVNDRDIGDMDEGCSGHDFDHQAAQAVLASNSLDVKLYANFTFYSAPGEGDGVAQMTYTTSVDPMIAGTSYSTQAVPEPASWGLVAVGLMMLRRQRK